MSTVIICILLALIIIFAVVNSAKHFRGEGGCCGGGSDIKVKKKKLANVKETLVISIDGMTCKNCSMRIQNKLNEMDNVSADVNLQETGCCGNRRWCVTGRYKVSYRKIRLYSN